MGNDIDDDMDTLEKDLRETLAQVEKERQEQAKVEFEERVGEEIGELFEKVTRENPAINILLNQVIAYFDDQAYPAMKRMVAIADVCQDDARTLILSLEKVILETHLRHINEKLKEKKLV